MGYIAPAILGFGIGLGINKVIRTVAGEAYPDLKDYTTIEPTAKNQGSATGWITERSNTLRILQNKMMNYGRDYEPSETKFKTEDLEFAEYGLSQYGLVRYIQKNFTKRGKLAVQDKKLKSVEK